MHIFSLPPPVVVVTAWAVLISFLFVLAKSFEKANLGRRDLWFIVSLLAAAAPVLFSTAYRASNLPIVPDSVEAAVGAERLFHLGSYSIVVDGAAQPPRYLPWFSWLFLVPLYSLCPSLGSGVYLIFLCSLAAVLAAYLLGRSAGGAGGRVLCGIVSFGGPRIFGVLERDSHSRAGGFHHPRPGA